MISEAVSSSSISPRHCCVDIHHDIRVILNNPWFAHFAYVLISANSCIDYMAKRGALGNQGFCT